MTHAHFADPWNPTLDEVRRWAFDPDARWPDEDWDIALTWSGLEFECLTLAADAACPARDFFLHVLYLHVGDAVRGEFSPAWRARVEALLDAASDASDERIRLWRERSLRLIDEPESFDYDAWCDGGLASERHERR